MIAKIIAYGRTRDEALARLRRAMARDHRGHRGRRHQQELHPRPARPVRGDRRQAGWADTGWIDRVRAEGRLVVHEHSGIAVVAAGIEAYEDEEQVEIARLLETAHGGRPQVQHQVGRAVDFKLRGTPYKVTVLQTGPQRFRVGVAAAGVDARGRRRRRAARRVPHPAHRRRPSSTGWSPPPTARCTWSRSTASPTGSAATRAACCARRPRRSWSPRPSPVGDVVDGRRPGARAREHEDGDGAARAVRGPGRGAPGDHRQPGRDRRAAGPARAGRRRCRRRGSPASDGRRRPSTCRRPGSRLDRPGTRRARPRGPRARS